MGHAVLAAIDWGTTHARAILLDAQGDVADIREMKSGVGSYRRDEFENTFDFLVDQIDGLPAIMAGMVGSRQGWQEAGYLPCPARASDFAANLHRFTYDDHDIAIVPGLAKETPGAEDVMRGEETQIAGLLIDNPDFSGTAVLPGTHSKWARIESGVIVDFRTYMSGDIFAALKSATILRHSLEDYDEEASHDNAIDAFESALERIDGGLSTWGQLFTIRAQDIMLGLDALDAHETLSALVLMMEFEAAKKDGLMATNLHLIGGQELMQRYALIAQSKGLNAHCHGAMKHICDALVGIAQQAGIVSFKAGAAK